MLQPNERRDNFAGVCYTDDAPPSPAPWSSIWKRPDQFAFTDGVPLTAGSRLQCQTPASNPPTERRSASAGAPSARKRFHRCGQYTVGIVDLGFGTSAQPASLWRADHHRYVRRGVYRRALLLRLAAGQCFQSADPPAGGALFTSIAEESVNSFVFRIAFPQQPQIHSGNHAPAPRGRELIRSP